MVQTSVERPGEAELLQHVAETLFSELDAPAVSQAIVRAAGEAVHAERALLYRISAEAELHPLAEFADGGTRALTGEGPARELPAARRALIEQGAPTTTDDVSGEAITPIASNGHALGLLVMAPPPGRGYEPDELRILDGIARMAGLALSSAARLEQEQIRGEKLAELARSKSQFLNLAAHELRGPMTVLMGYLSLLEDGAFGELPAEFSSTFPVINARIAEMESLINAMLETSRLEENRLDLMLEDTDVRELVETAVSRSKVFAQKDQQINVELPDKAIPAHVDRSRIVIAIANLVQNALKYSVKHTDISVVVKGDGNGRAVVIRDQGIGIDEQDFPVLFTRFGRIRRDPAAAGIPGTGLGLYLSRELVRAHGGDVSVVSQPGSGSVFTLTLPRRKRK
jgi:signal transduction histidine kinase